MKTLKLWQIDAFAQHPYEGNPAAVVPLQSWLPDVAMQKIAGENNLSETAFFVETGPGKYDLRWFTPASEVDLCGHATLASAWLLFNTLAPTLNSVSFHTRSGELVVNRADAGALAMSLPTDPIAPFPMEAQFGIDLGVALGVPAPVELHFGRYLMAVWNKAQTIRTMNGPGAIAPLLRKAASWGLIVTAQGDDGHHFVSRFFAPDKGVPEDPVTGSAHCSLAPYWSKKLGLKTMKARQVSRRGGDLTCTYEGARTVLTAPCALYMTADIRLP